MHTQLLKERICAYSNCLQECERLCRSDMYDWLQGDKDMTGFAAVT